MIKPDNDTALFDTLQDEDPMTAPMTAPMGGPAKVLSVLLTLVQAVQVLAFVLLLGVAAAFVFGFMDTGAMAGQSITAGGHMALIFYALGSVVVMIAVVWQLRKLVRTLRIGNPFAQANVLRLRNIWMILAAGELARTIIHPFIERLETASDLTFDVRPHVWFFVLILIVLAQVFKEGARLEAEARLTV